MAKEASEAEQYFLCKSGIPEELVAFDVFVLRELPIRYEFVVFNESENVL